MMSSRIRRLGLSFAAAVLGISLTGCTGLGGGDGDGDLDFDQWTVFVYASVDNHQGFTFLERMRDMARAQFGRATGDTRTVNLVVYADFNSADGQGGGNLPDGAGFDTFPTGTRVYHVPGNNTPIRLIAQDDERDFDSGATFLKYMKDCFTRFPSQRRMVLLYGPGGGWITQDGGPNINRNDGWENEWQGGFGGDVGNGAYVGPVDCVAMSAPEVATAIQTAAASLSSIDATWGNPQPVDIVAYDAGLMGSLDCAWSFQTVAKTYVAPSELDLSNQGFDYTGMLTWIAGNTKDTAAEHAAAMVSFWDKKHYVETIFPTNELVPERDWRGCIALNLDQTLLGDIATRVDALRLAIFVGSAADQIECMRQQYFSAPGYGQADTNDIMYESPVSNDTSEPREEGAARNPPGQDMDDACAYNILKLPYYRDFRHFLLNIENETAIDVGIRTAASDLRGAVEAVIIESSRGSLRRQFGQAGLNVELALGHPWSHNSGAPPFDHHPSDRRLFTFSLEGSFPLVPHWYADLVDGGAGWRDFMDQLVGPATPAPTIDVVGVANLTAQGALESQKPTLYLRFPDAKTCYAAVTLESLDTKQRWALVSDSYVIPGVTYKFIWGGERYAISANGVSGSWQPVMVMPSGQIGPGPLPDADPLNPSVTKPWKQVSRQYQIPGFITVSERKYQCALLLNDNGNETIDTITVKAYGWNTPRPLSDFAGNTFQARIHGQVDGWSTYVPRRWDTGPNIGVPVPPAAGAFYFRPQSVEPGQYRLIVEAVNSDGHIGRESREVSVLSQFGPAVTQSDRRSWSSLVALR